MSNTKTIWSVIAGLLSSVFAFLGIVSCCGMPILAGVLAALGIGASQLSFFVEFRVVYCICNYIASVRLLSSLFKEVVQLL